MQDSHKPAFDDDQVCNATAVSLAPAVSVVGLPEQLTERVDGHLAVFVERMREGLLAASTAVGLEVMAELMAAEVTELAGPKGKHDPERSAKRHGSEHGAVTLGGRRLPVRRPRVRSVGDDEQEVALESYDVFAATDLLTDGIVARMLAGLSTRRYDAGLEPVGDAVTQAASGTSKSAVSRRFVTATADKVSELLARPLGGEHWLIVYLDGFHFGEHCLVGALGVNAGGTKVPLGLVEGSTENAAVCTRLVRRPRRPRPRRFARDPVRRRRRQGLGRGHPRGLRRRSPNPTVPPT